MGRKPDYYLTVYDKTTEGRTQAGAAWVQQDGSISITINPCVMLPSDRNLSIKLFPNEHQDEPEQPQPRRATKQKPRRNPARCDDYDDPAELDSRRLLGEDMPGF